MPDPDLHGFDAAGAARIVQAVRRVEAMPQRPRISGHLGVPNWQLVRVTDDEGCDNSSEDSSGDSAESSVRYYPAVLEMWDATNEAAEDIPDGVCWLVERHDYPLIVGNTYMAQMSGDKTICGEMRTVFVTAIGVAGLDDSVSDDPVEVVTDVTCDGEDLVVTKTGIAVVGGVIVLL
jgi:hypothetical protein